MPERVHVEWDDILDLVLDPENPRHESGKSRRAIIEYLVTRESVLGLAKDIAAEGLSPLENFGALRNADDDLIVVEGNRRLCALLLIHDPNLAPPKERAAFEALHESFDPGVLSIEVMVFDDEEQASLWIERKHGGLDDGRGPRPWNATQKARHFGDKTGNALALALLEYAVENKLITEEERQQRNLTTVTRFVSNAYVRTDGLGITTGRNDPDFRYTGAASLFKKRLKQLLTDIINKLNGATSRTDSEAREIYAQNYLVPLSLSTSPAGETNAGSGEHSSEVGAASGGREGTSSSSENGSNGAAGAESEGESNKLSESTTDASQRKSGTHPDKRPRLVSETFNPGFVSQPLERVLRELKEARRASPMAAALIVRVFLEAISIVHAETHLGFIAKQNDKLHLLVHKVLGDLQDRMKKGEIELTKPQASALGALKSEVGNQTYVYSAFYLGLVAHGSAFPQWATLTSKWDEIEAIVAYIAEHCEKPIV